MHGTHVRQRKHRHQLWGNTIITLVLFCALSTSLRPVHALPVGGIINIKPQVQVHAEKQKGWKVVGERFTLGYGDYIRTNKDGKADVLFNNGTEILMRSNTQIQIIAPASADKPLVVRVFGALSEIFVRAKGNTEIHTEASNAAVRGTEFLIRLPAADCTTLTVIEGVVDFANANGKVTVRAAQQSTARVGEAPSAPMTVDVTGLIAWTADITSLPVEFETPMGTMDPGALATQQQQAEAEVKAAPLSPEAHRRLARVLYDRGSYAAAIQEFAELARLAPNDAQAQIGLGTALRTSGDLVNAQQAFARALALTPTNREARLGQALVLLAKRDFAGARAQLDLAPAQAATTAIRGLLALREGQPDQATRLLMTAITDDATLYQAHALLALARLTQNQLPGAEDAARKAVALQPFSAQAHATLAMVLFFSHQERDAMLAAKRATQLNPFSPFALLTQGRTLLAQDRLDEARNAFQQAQALAPDLPLLYTELGQVYLRLNLIPKAEVAFRKALALQVISPDAHTGLGVCLQMQGHTAQAIAEHQRALTLDPKHAVTRVNLAAIYTEQGQFDKAEEALQLGTADQPEHGLFYARLAELSLYRQQLFQAQVYAQRAVALLPNSAIAHFVLGQVYQEQGRIVQAGDQFRLAATLDPQYAAARYALGVVSERVANGTDLARPLGAITAANQSGAGQALSLQNLQGPGAGDRIQAAIQNPTVVRVASRSFGDVQIDGAIGEADAQDASLSYLHESDNRREVVSVQGRHESNDGIRENADYTNDQLGVSYGWKAANHPFGLFTMAQIRKSEQGNDLGPISKPLLSTSQSRNEFPSFLVGGTLQSGGGQRTSALAVFARPRNDTTDMGGYTNNTLRSQHGEVRHDIAVKNHRISLGFNAGSRKRTADSLLLGIPGIFPDLHSIIDFDISWTQAYLHDTVALAPNLSIIGDLYFNRFTYNTQTAMVSPPPPMSFKRGMMSQVALPSVAVAWQPTSRSGLRVRARGVAGSIEDFQLLNPVEVFLFDTADLPSLWLADLSRGNVTGRGQSAEAEYDYSFADSSFLRIGVLDQRVHNTFNADGEFLRRSTFRSVSLRYERVLTPTMTGFLGAMLIDAHGIVGTGINQYTPDQELSDVPRYKGEIGVQYLHPRGWFVQHEVGLIGTRLHPPFQNNPVNPRLQADAFMVTNLRIGKRSGLHSTVFFEVDNLFNQGYSLLGGGMERAQPGRHVLVGLSQRF